MRNWSNVLILFLIIIDTISCGGGGNNTPSIFDGHYTGNLSGISCVTNATVEIAVTHDVDADSDESGGAVSVKDQDGKSYMGTVILTANTVAQIWGFSAEAEDANDGNFPSNIFYNIANTASGHADVSANFTISEGDPRSPGGCSYTLEGILEKN